MKKLICLIQNFFIFFEMFKYFKLTFNLYKITILLNRAGNDSFSFH